MLECLSIDYDHRIKCFAATCKTNYEWYLNNTKGSEHLLDIQRKIISGRKTYQTLRADLQRGCILPPIVLAVSEIETKNCLPSVKEKTVENVTPDHLVNIAKAINERSNTGIRIVDGLQRTNALRDVSDNLQDEELLNFLSTPIRLEFWINIKFVSLAYRMLLLNAGQKPMSMKHQIEIVADRMKDELASIDNIEVITGIEGQRRTSPGQFQLSVLAGAFQAWLQKQPHIDLRNAVTEQLLAEEALDDLGKGMSPAGSTEGADFEYFVDWLVKLDFALGNENTKFLGNDTAILGLSAGIASAFANESLRERCKLALTKILQDISEKGPEEGFSPSSFDTFRQSFDVKKINVGKASRELVSTAITEFIWSGGTKSMKDCWVLASAKTSAN